MDKKFYESSKFTALNKQWYKKLKKSGFVEAEYLDDKMNPTMFMKSVGGTIGRASSATFIKQDVLEYYLMCSQWAHMAPAYDYSMFISKKVSKDLILKLWALHCDGLTYSEIYKHINARRKRIGLKKIKKIINTMESRCFALFGIKARK